MQWHLRYSCSRTETKIFRYKSCVGAWNNIIPNLNVISNYNEGPKRKLIIVRMTMTSVSESPVCIWTWEPKPVPRTVSTLSKTVVYLHQFVLMRWERRRSNVYIWYEMFQKYLYKLHNEETLLRIHSRCCTNKSL